MENYSTIEVAASFTDRHWKAYLGLIIEIQQAKDEPCIFGSWQDLERSRMAEDETRLTEMIICSGDELAGRLRLRRRNATFIEAEIETKYAEPPVSLMLYLVRLLLQKMRELNIERVSCRSGNRTLNNFLEAKGAQVMNHYLHYELERAKANLDKINQWLNIVPAKNPLVRIEIQKGIPDEHVNEYAEMFIGLLADMPRNASLPPSQEYSAEDIRRDLRMNAASNREPWSGLLFEGNKLIGQTNLAIYQNDPHHAFQFMTGVRKEYRGRGLAKWLKAAMLNHVLAFTPQPSRIYTSTYSLNVPMQNINFALGYELKKEGYEYSILRGELEKNL